MNFWEIVQTAVLAIMLFTSCAQHHYAHRHRSRHAAVACKPPCKVDYERAYINSLEQ